MALKWLRRHRRTIWMPVAAVVIVTLVFVWGARPERGASGGPGAPEVAIAGRKVPQNRFLNTRYALERLMGRRVQEHEVVAILLAGHILDELGMDVAPVRVSEQISHLVSRRAKTAVPSRQDIERFFADYGIPLAELTELLRIIIGWADLQASAAGAAVYTDAELFACYRRNQQMLAFAYRDFPVAEHLEKTSEPTGETVRLEYERYASLDERDAQALVHPSRYRFAYVWAANAKFAAAVTVTDEALKQYYEQYKRRYRDDAGQAKPFEQVRSELEKDYRERESSRQALEALEKAHEALTKALEDMKKAEPPPPIEGQPAAPRRPDEAAVTAALQKSAEGTLLDTGVMDWLDAPGFANLEPFGNAQALQLALSRIGGSSDFFSPSAPRATEKGMVVAVLLGYEPAKPVAFDEAKPRVVERMRRDEARRLARTAAEAVVDAITRPGATTGLDALEGRLSLKAAEAPAEFQHLALGELAQNAVLMDEDTDKEAYRIAALIARKLPTYTEYENDGAFRKMRAMLVEDSRRNYMFYSYFEHWRMRIEVTPAALSNAWVILWGFDSWLRTMR